MKIVKEVVYQASELAEMEIAQARWFEETLKRMDLNAREAMGALLAGGLQLAAHPEPWVELDEHGLPRFRDPKYASRLAALAYQVAGMMEKQRDRVLTEWAKLDADREAGGPVANPDGTPAPVAGDLAPEEGGE